MFDFLVRNADSFSGGAIGAGLFIGSGGAFRTGGPAAVLLGFMIIGKCKKQLLSLGNELTKRASQVP